MPSKIQIRDLGLIDWLEAYEIQKAAVAEVLNGGPESLILCEHPPVLTLGRMTKSQNILYDSDKLANMGLKTVSVDRGGDVTLHAPGQLVVYPILDLSRHGRDLKKYLHELEEVSIEFLRGFGILALRFPGRTGVWSCEKKVVSIGIGVRKWISYHGLGINLNTDLSLFRAIRPCGLDVAMASVQSLTGKSINLNQAKEQFSEIFLKHFYPE